MESSKMPNSPDALPWSESANRLAAVHKSDRQRRKPTFRATTVRGSPQQVRELPAPAWPSACARGGAWFYSAGLLRPAAASHDTLILCFTGATPALRRTATPKLIAAAAVIRTGSTSFPSLFA
ncbi:hypothetical protein V6N13_122154 [Hibiscus sabdariffa]